ncbi:TPA: VOC family protein [Clostridioides difficile]
MQKTKAWGIIEPEKPESQQQMAHMDFAVNDLEEAVQYAIHCGATIAEEQFTDDWRVMIDPAGHHFCLCQMKSIMESSHFSFYRPKYCLLITKKHNSIYHYAFTYYT